MIKLKKNILPVPVLIFLFFLTFPGVFPCIANAGTPHIIYGTLRNSDDSIPPDNTIKFEGYIAGRPGEVLTESDTGCGYGGGMWWIEAGNFPTPWSADEVLHITTTNTITNTKSTGSTNLSNDGKQNVLLTVPKKDNSDGDGSDSNVKGNAGDTSGCFISTTGYEAHTGIFLECGITVIIIGVQSLLCVCVLFLIFIKKSAKISINPEREQIPSRLTGDRSNFLAMMFLGIIIIFQSVFITGKAFASSVTFNLKPGLNAVSVPFEDSGITNVEELLNAAPDCDLLKLWNQSEQKFTEYQKGSGTDMTVSGKAVFVRVTANADLHVTGEVPAHPDFHLKKTGTTSINAVYLPYGRTDLADAEALCNEIPNCDTVWKWVPEKQGYEGHPKGTAINNFSLAPGHSYFVNVTAEGIWTQIPLGDIDNDKDGFTENQDDCNDNDSTVYPGAPELCNNDEDNDCDGKTDCADSDCEGEPSCQTCTDTDGDGIFAESGCGEDVDCNDNDAGVYPGASETCNDNRDNDCDGKTGCDDPDCSETPVCQGCTDADSDGYYAKDSCNIGDDCNDNNAGIHPGAADICGDGTDQDCNGSDFPCPPAVASTIPGNNATDADVDTDIFAIFSGEMNSSTVNRDTFYVQTGDDLKTVEGTVSYSGILAKFSPDSPLDYGTRYKVTVTTGAENLAGNSPEYDYIWSFTTIPGDTDNDGYTVRQGDCNDNDGTVHPGADEICNDSTDNDCDGNYDCADPECSGDSACRACTDTDHDGYYAESGCGVIADCNDYDAAVYPGAPELCNDYKDNDCNVRSDCDDAACANAPECRVCTDTDSDGFYAESDCGTLQDCNDYDTVVYPGAFEICNDNKDNNCDGETDCDDSECIEDSACVTCTDADSDGFYAESGCGTVTDCNDENADIYPGAAEICGDGKDQDCTGTDLLCTVLPVVVSASPGNNETVDVNVRIIVTFSQVMDSRTINNDTFHVRTGEGYGLQDISGAVSCSGAVATFTPDSSLDYEKTYQAVITTDVQNLGGTSAGSDYLWSFTTLPKGPASGDDADNDGDGYTENQEDCNDNDAGIFPGAPEICGDETDQDCDGADLSCDTPPLVKTASPGDLTTNVNVDTDISAVFSQAMDPLSISEDTFYVRTGDAYGYKTIAGTVSYSGPTSTLTFSPGSSLDYRTVYEVIVTTGVKNTGGTSLGSDYTWSFTTISQADVDNDGDGYTENQRDCNDNDAFIYPGATEICDDSMDNDCDGNFDCGDSDCYENVACQQPICTDADSDGYYAQSGCGTVVDCNDGNAGIHPGASEVCGDEVDQDCDGSDCNLTYTNSLGMIFKRIPAGTFMMGSPADELGRNDDETLHQVTLTQYYYMQTTEVTQTQWEAVMGTNPSYFSGCGGDCPIEQVSWNDALNFIIELNKKGEGIYRLPTEAEWEYAARAGSNTAFANGGITADPLSCDNDANLDIMGFYCGNSCVDYAGGYDCSSWTPCSSKCGINLVAQKMPNDFGLYDMHGNVLEWCQDWYGDYPSESVSDPEGPDTGTERVVRGGSWVDDAGSSRLANRNKEAPDVPSGETGFRLVLIISD